MVNDLALSLPRIAPDCHTVNGIKNEIVIGLVLIGFSNHDVLENIVKWTHNYFNNLGLRFKLKLIPFYDYQHSDIVEYKKLNDSVNIDADIEICDYHQVYRDIVNDFSECGLMISMRYHASLLAMKMGIPSVNICFDVNSHYYNKMNWLIKCYGFPELHLSYSNLDEASYVSATQYALANAEMISERNLSVSKKLEAKASKELNDAVSGII